MGNLLTSDSSYLVDRGKISPQIPDADQLIADIDKIQRTAAMGELFQREAGLQIATGSDVSLTFLSDLHLGGIQTQHKELLPLLNRIIETPNAYAAFLGDEVNQSFVFRDSDDVLSAMMQGQLFEDILVRLANAQKVAFMCTGNHNNFNRLWYGLYAENHGIPLIGPNMGLVHFGVGEVNYDICAFHQISMGNSTMSPALRAKRAGEYWYDADVYAGAHTHRKYIMQNKKWLGSQSKQVTMLEAGTFKTEDDFQSNYGNLRIPEMETGGVTLVFNHEQKDVTPFSDSNKGLDYLNARRFIAQTATSLAGLQLGGGQA